MSENCESCQVSARVDRLEKEFDSYRENSSETHKEMFKRLGDLEQARASMETMLEGMDAKLDKLISWREDQDAKLDKLVSWREFQDDKMDKLVSWKEFQDDKPNKLLDKLKESAIWMFLAAVIGVVLGRLGL